MLSEIFAQLGISGMDGAMLIIAGLMIVGGVLQLIAAFSKKTRRSSNSSGSRSRAARAGR